MKQPRLEETSMDSNAALDSYSVMMAEYPQDVNNNGIQGSGSRLMESGDSAMYPPGQKFGGSAMLSDSVDIRSCVLLGNPQPFRTWNGQVWIQPRDVKGMSEWLHKFAEQGSIVVENSEPINNNSIGDIVHQHHHHQQQQHQHHHHHHQHQQQPQNDTGTRNMINITENTIQNNSRIGILNNNHLTTTSSLPPMAMASSREFQFHNNEKLQNSNFAKVTARRLQTHIRQFKQDTGFSLWMRNDLAGWIEDRGKYELETLRLKAKDYVIKTHSVHKKLDQPETVLAAAHQRISTILNDNAPPISKTFHLRRSHKLPAFELSHSENNNNTNKMDQNKQQSRLRQHGTSTINNLSSRILATQPPPIKHKIIPFKEKQEEPYIPPPVLDGSSKFSPICGITSMRPVQRYTRRTALPNKLPRASSVVGIGYEESEHTGLDAVEAAAVQAAIACNERNKEYKRKKLALASRRG